ncbi:MAG: hypothetical protein HOP04_02545 [Methylophilaceae bacterium]|nr:hypothetical protein [Methylophilaceae bacterium]
MHLPDLPGDIQTLPAFETSAIAQRLDLQAQRLETEAIAQQLGFTKATRFSNVLELGPVNMNPAAWRVDNHRLNVPSDGLF